MSRLLAELRDAGVELVATARGTLRVKTGGRELDPRLKASIVTHRDELLAALEAERPASRGTTAPVRKPAEHSPGEPTSDRERRRQAVLDMLAGNPALRYAWLVEPESELDDGTSSDVIVALAIRDVGSCELTIERERYEPFRLLELIAAGDPGANGETEQGRTR